MRITLTIFLIFLATILFGQNRHVSFGFKGNGICFGNSSDYNGIRLNFIDKNVNSVNGLNVSGHSKIGISNGLSVGFLLSEDSISNGLKIGGLVTGRKTNGISFGFLVSNDTISNGLKIGVLGAIGKRHNGLALSILNLTGEKYNGIGVAGFNIQIDTANGLFVGLSMSSRNFDDTLKIVNGIVIAPFGVITSKVNGLAISFWNLFNKQKGVAIALVNVANELHGFQFGLINYAKNNRRLFRWMPFINFNLRKNDSS